MWLSVANEQYSVRDCATYKVRNRSDRPVQAFDVELSISGGGGFGAASSPLAPGQTAELKACGGGGHGGVPGNPVRLLVFARSVDFGDCFYRPQRESRAVWMCILCGGCLINSTLANLNLERPARAAVAGAIACRWPRCGQRCKRRQKRRAEDCCRWKAVTMEASVKTSIVVIM
jgi:hypothetical protein